MSETRSIVVWSKPEHEFTDTEIDWETYMIQIEVYLKGQRDYSKITGPTGPLV